MDFYGIRDAVEKLHMPEDMRRRIAANTCQRKEHTMKKRYRKPAVIAAVLTLCLCLPIGTMAAGRTGHFKDILGWNNAVIGTTYENATEEILVTAARQQDTLVITAVLLKPDSFPYREIETLSIGAYTLNGAAQEATDPVSLQNGTAVFRIPCTEEPEQLEITSFVGHKKAEQPLPIKGSWIMENE